MTEVKDASLPRILACGYYCIASPKSHFIFPTILVQLDEIAPPVWRSKRDFLLLGRASEHKLPKAAYAKLIGNDPWKRPHFAAVFDSKATSDGNNNEGHNETFEEVNKYHPSMKKSIHFMDQFLQCCCGENDAWRLFARPVDTEGSFPHTQRDHQSMRITDTRRASQLGQYFAAPENAQHVVSLILEQQQCSNAGVNNPSHVVFLEPSCGHGDILEVLVAGLRETKTTMQNVTIIGMDLDANAIKACQNRFQDGGIIWKHGDFLKSKRSNVLANGNETDYTVFCLGGPPYSAGAGNGETDMMLNLPELFVKHCVDEWQAKAICFLMPQRYQKHGTVITENDDWNCKSIPLNESKFYFQGKAVIQPSIIQLYTSNSSQSPS